MNKNIKTVRELSLELISILNREVSGEKGFGVIAPKLDYIRKFCIGEISLEEWNDPEVDIIWTWGDDEGPNDPFDKAVWSIVELLGVNVFCGFDPERTRKAVEKVSVEFHGIGVSVDWLVNVPLGDC